MTHDYEYEYHKSNHESFITFSYKKNSITIKNFTQTVKIYQFVYVQNRTLHASVFSHEYLSSGLFSHDPDNVLLNTATNPRRMKQSRCSAKTRVNEKYNNGHTRK